MAQRRKATSDDMRKLTTVINKAYPPALIRKLGKDHDLPDDYTTWRHGIKKAARIFLLTEEQLRHQHEGRECEEDYPLIGPPDLTLQECRVLAKAARTLSAGLNSQKGERIAHQVLLLAETGRLKWPIPENDAVMAAELYCRQISADVSTIAFALEDMAKWREPQPNKRGPKGDLAMLRYVDYIRDYWLKDGRRFTLDYHSGEGLSPAFRFVSDCIAPIADVPHKRIITAMRKVIRERNRPLSDYDD